MIVFLVLSGGSAYGEWVPLSSGGTVGTMYIDPDTIRRKENLVKMWHLADFKTIQNYQGSSYLSIKAQSQYDCREEQSRVLREIGFSENMGGGNVAYSISTEKAWKPVAPDSLALLLWEIACGKK